MDDNAEKTHNRIMIKHLPQEINRNGIDRMCGRFGKVQDIISVDEKRMAFVAYQTNAEAQNAIRQLHEEFKNLCVDIIVRFATPRNSNKAPITAYEEPEYPLDADDKSSSENNVPNMDEREIKGPFGTPSNIDALLKPHLTELDYQNCSLNDADPEQMFRWRCDEEFYLDYEAANQKIVNGRIVSPPSDTVTDIDGMIKGSFKHYEHPQLLDAFKMLCLHCDAPADKCCSLCSKHICSTDCTRLHENHCEKMSKSMVCNVSEAKLTCDVTAKRITLEKSMITYVVNHRTVFVRSILPNPQNKFIRLMNDFAEYEKNIGAYECVSTRPSIGTLYLVECGNMKHRVMVLKYTSKLSVLVGYVDYGNVEERLFTSLKYIPQQVNNHNVYYATRIRLSDVNEDLMNPVALYYLYNLMASGVELQMQMLESQIIDGSLTYVASLMAPHDRLNDIVNKLNRTIPAKVASADIDYLNINDLERNDIPVIVLNNSLLDIGSMSIIQEKHVRDIAQIHRMVQAVCNYRYTENSQWTPKLEQWCVVRCENQWYRARCIESGWDDFFTCELVDFGGIGIYNSSDVKPLPTDLYMPTVTATIIVSYAEGDSEMVKALTKKHPIWSYRRFSFKGTEFSAANGECIISGDLK